jgi:hypothetical protein
MKLAAVPRSNPQFQSIAVKHRSGGVLDVDEGHARLPLVQKEGSGKMQWKPLAPLHKMRFPKAVSGKFQIE